MSIRTKKYNKRMFILVVVVITLLIAAGGLYFYYYKNVLLSPGGCTTNTNTVQSACTLTTYTTTCCPLYFEVTPELSILGLRSVIASITGQLIAPTGRPGGGLQPTQKCSTSSNSICSPRGDLGVCCSCGGGSCGNPGENNCCTMENTQQLCSDEWDNDCDGLKDLNDPDCCPSDGNACTFEFVNGGVCQSIAIPDCMSCDSEMQCDDHDVSTANLCVSGRCVFQALS